MLRARLFVSALAAAAASLSAGAASATIINLSVASGGIDHERTCTTTACSSVVWTMPGGSLPAGTVFPATGTITIDTVALTMTLSLSVATASIDGAADNGVTALTLSSTTYTSGPLPITVSGPVGGVTSYSISAGQTAVVDPSLVSETGGGSSDPIFPSARVTGQCGLLADNTGSCGFTFGRVGLLMPAPLGRYLEQTLNVGVVPEPGTALLVAAGLLGLGVAGTRRR